MNMENFEQKLSRRPMREIPGEWREEILAATGRTAKVENRGQEQFWLSSLVSRLSTILWPCPQAWVGLATVWILILAVNFSDRDKTPAIAEKSAPPSPEMMAQLRQQHRLLVELIGANQTHDAEPPKVLPFPRSERLPDILTA
jgi:hypothetical protein